MGGGTTNKPTQNQKIETLRDTTDTKMETKPRKNKKEGDLSEAQRCRHRESESEGKGPSSRWARTETKLSPPNPGPQLSKAFSPALLLRMKSVFSHIRMNLIFNQ